MRGECWVDGWVGWRDGTVAMWAVERVDVMVEHWVDE